jgi:ribokinase
MRARSSPPQPRGGEAVTDGAVFSAGTVNADLVMRVDAPLERGATLIAPRPLRTSGGRGANVAVMARRLGTAARLFGCIGVDDLTEQALAGPGAAGVDIAGVRCAPAHTGLVTILVAQDGSKTMIFAPGANDEFSEADGARLAADLQHAAGRCALVVDTELSPAALLPALGVARESGRPSVLDPTRPERLTTRLLELADHVMPNADEAALLTGVAVESPADARRAARRLHDRGARHVHIRLPRGGCLTLWPAGEALLRPPAGVDVVDTTGAGDAFAGTLAAALLAGCAALEAARRAVAAAACAVARLGAQESYPDRDAVDAMARMVRVEPW